MIKYTLIALSFVFSYNINAQETEEEVLFESSFSNHFERPKSMLKLALLSQLDFNSPSLQLGYEFKVHKNLGIHQELGYVNNWLNPIYALLDHNFSRKQKIKNGLKYILEPRFYIFGKDKAFSSRMFITPAFDFRYVVIQRKEWVTRNLSFQQNMKYNVQKLAYGMHAKFGISTSVKKRMPIEIVLGIGARYTTLKNNLPDDATTTRGSNNFLVPRPRIEGNFWSPSVHLGMLLHLPTKKIKK